jgi:hypothetical protein
VRADTIRRYIPAWAPRPDARQRPDAEVPGPWSPLLALAPRLRAVRDLVHQLRARLAPSGPDSIASSTGRPAGAAGAVGRDDSGTTL